MANTDTIAAIATAPGRGGIGVVRVSGKQIESLAVAILGQLPPPRHAQLSLFLDDSGDTLDQGIALYFPAPHSYTGEDVLELQGHGGTAVMSLLLDRCLALGARLAEPGEFTRRAYLNNKLDLAQAESVADVISASTAAAARAAVRSLQGEFSASVRELVAGLTHLRMLVEATLDFPEEEIDFLQKADARGKLSVVQESLAKVLVVARQGSLLREGLQVVLVGQPNVGKSSLMNCLAGEEVAIVTDVPGTTRDALRQAIAIEGVVVHLIDTAGLRESRDAVEQIGMARTRAAIEKADLILVIVDSRIGLTPEDHVILSQLPAALPQIQVFNKTDLCIASDAAATATKVAAALPVGQAAGESRISLSAKTGEGVERLRKKLLEMAGWQAAGEGVCIARARHVQALQTCLLYTSPSPRD